ncbi:TetR/AcrR family transcriptional regulator [Gulosibacter chungangensis]|uniref:TetR/AcrR family transcriptional regulator n=1 Tax=Gulosibacter chungangensis TaxID=979746 RepID=A0A7J5BC03_9MICO|nr:TetR/AcrR family transcriptional regulator [Gulosibacter chungangensis]KAB1643078.1 TetR/AcrR family transcriptional regulator [Gulosibacter chungangensis]
MAIQDNSSTDLDPRAVRSYNTLVATMLEVLDRGDDPAAASITEIVKAAGVSRPTFYQHFIDVPDLVRAATLHRLSAIFERIPAEGLGGTWEEFAQAKLRILLGALQQDAQSYLSVLRGPAAVQVTAGVIDFLADQLLNHSPIGTVIGDGLAAGEARSRAEFLGAGATWRVVRWLATDFTGDNELDAMVARLAANILAAAGPGDRDFTAAAP